MTRTITNYRLDIIDFCHVSENKLQWNIGPIYRRIYRKGNVSVAPASKSENAVEVLSLWSLRIMLFYAVCREHCRIHCLSTSAFRPTTAYSFTLQRWLRLHKGHFVYRIKTWK